jgi:Flp pilus assembly protein TadD
MAGHILHWMKFLHIMRHRCLVGFGFCLLLAGMAHAQQDAPPDPSDLFLNAYTQFQNGEQLERESQPQRALMRFKDAEQKLVEITKLDAEWQPMVVEYRLKKTRESIARLEAETEGMAPLAEELEGELPSDEVPAAPPAQSETGRFSLPPVTTTPPRTTTRPRTQSLPSPPPTSDSPTLSKALRDLAAAKKELATANARNEELAAKLQKSDADLKSALFEIDRTKVTVVELKSKLAQAQVTIENIKRDGGDQQSIREQRQAETAEFLKRLAESSADAEVLRDENERLLAKLESAANYISESDKIREELLGERRSLADARRQAEEEAGKLGEQLAEAQTRQEAVDKELATKASELAEMIAANTKLEEELAEARKSGASDEEIGRLTAENTRLQTRLAEAEAAVSGDGGRDAATAALQGELNEVNDRLLRAEADVARRDARIEELVRQLDETSGELARLRLLPIPSPEEQRLLAENDLLRGIILRQIKMQNRRDEAIRAVEEELVNLKVESATLAGHLKVLATPVLELSPEERSLFKDPVSLLTETAPSTMEVDLAITMPTAEEAAQNIQADGPQGASALTPEARELVRTAQDFFNDKNYEEAEKLYQQIAEMLPENYFVLSNLGAVQIESGKLSAAEVALGRAIELSPEDSFAHTHLGIAFSRQGRFDEARSALTAAIELNPNDAIAYNYLGVCLAQQGMRDDAESNLQKAIELSPEYANAHFNLAVLYATTKPPSFELARQHYDRATQLGAAPDDSLERLIQ